MTNPASSQQPAPIPEDLKGLYREARATYLKAIWEGGVVACLVVRIARLEAALRDVDGTLCECRYSSDTPLRGECNCYVHEAHRIIHAALATPLGTPTTKEFMQKVCSDAYEGTPGREKP